MMPLKIKYGLEELAAEIRALANCRRELLDQIGQQQPIVKQLQEQLAAEQAKLGELLKKEKENWQEWEFVYLLGQRAGMGEQLLDKAKEYGLVATSATTPATVTNSNGAGGHENFTLILPDGRTKSLRGKTEAVRRFAELAKLWDKADRFDGSAICAKLGANYKDFTELAYGGYRLVVAQ